MTNTSFSFVIHTTSSSEQEVIYFHEGLLSESERFGLRDVNRVMKSDDLNILQCMTEPFLRSVSRNPDGHRTVSIVPLSHTKPLKETDVFPFLMSVIAPLSIVLLMVAFNTAWDAEMKEFILVMNAGRLNVLLAAIISNYVPTFLSMSAVFIVPVVFHDSKPFGVLYMAMLMFAFGVVVVGAFCAYVWPVVLGAIKTALVLWLLLVYFGVESPPIYRDFFLVLANQVNIVAAFKNILESFAYLDGRGVPVNFDTLFNYTDIVNPGISLVCLAVDCVLYIILTILVDSVDLKGVLAEICYSCRKKELHQLRSITERQSWHQGDAKQELRPLIRAENLSKVWENSGELAVYRFEIKSYRGEVSVLVGHSGCGKSTVIKMICGIIQPTKGRLRICSEDFSRRRAYCRSKIGYCPQANLLYSSLTVMEHLWFVRAVKCRYNESRRERSWMSEANVLVKSLKMKEVENELAGTLSQAQKRKLCVALAFVGGSRVVLLDSPTNGMDLESRQAVTSLVENQKEDRAIMVTTQRMEDAESMGQHVYVMYMGRTICSGDVSFVRGSFGSEYILMITPAEKDADLTMLQLEQTISRLVPGAKLRSKHGGHMKMELPKLQSRLGES